MVYSQLAAAPTANVGTDHPIALPRITFDKVKKTFGVKLAQGNLGTIYRVNVDGDASRRVYKATSQSKFKDGNTIVISKIASDQRVAPTFYSAFILDPTEGQDGKSFVVIEMDDAGKSLGSELKELEEAAQVEEDKKEAEKEKSVKKRSPSAEQEQMQEFLKIAQARMVAEFGDTHASESKPEKKTLPKETAIDKLYEKREDFYYELFVKIKILAENKIAYVDCNLGNIMPNRDNTKGLRIIDFDDAELMSDERLARNRSLTSLSNTERLFAAFKELPNLSARSIELIAWFTPFRDD